MLKGFSLVEIIVAMGIFAILITGSVNLIDLTSNSVRLAAEYDAAYSYLNSGIEGVRSIRKDSWSNLNNGNYGLEIDSGSYILSEDADTWNKYTRSIEIEDGGSADEKKITITVSWDFYASSSKSVSQTILLTNWNKLTL